jgi:hypothetical protein
MLSEEARPRSRTGNSSSGSSGGVRPVHALQDVLNPAYTWTQVGTLWPTTTSESKSESSPSPHLRLRQQSSLEALLNDICTKKIPYRIHPLKKSSTADDHNDEGLSASQSTVEYPAGKASQMIHSLDDVTMRDDLVDGVRYSDWQSACYICWNPKHRDISSETNTTIFLELLRIMRQHGVELHASNVKQLLKFLVKSKEDNAATMKILRMIYDQSDNTLKVERVELVMMTTVLLRAMKQSPNLLSSAIVNGRMGSNYLSVFPATLVEVECLSTSDYC